MWGGRAELTCVSSSRYLWKPTICHKSKLLACYIHSFIHLWLYRTLLGPDLFFSFVIFFCTDGRTPWMGISPSQGCYLQTEQHKHRINAHRHPCIRASEDSSCLRPRGHHDRAAHSTRTSKNCWTLCYIENKFGTRYSASRSSMYIVAYLLKARIVKPEKRPLLSNGCVTTTIEQRCPVKLREQISPPSWFSQAVTFPVLFEWSSIRVSNGELNFLIHFLLLLLKVTADTLCFDINGMPGTSRAREKTCTQILTCASVKPSIIYSISCRMLNSLLHFSSAHA
jgi:hypothetical protein